MPVKRHFFIAGYTSCGYFSKAKKALLGIEAVYPDEFTITVQEFSTGDEYRSHLPELTSPLGVNHRTSPLVWYEDERGQSKYLGGHDDTISWCKTHFSLTKTSSTSPALTPINIDPWNPNHGYKYDLVVIGGGSGGLACAKEAQLLGANVAILDYVKPSPHGSKWGLGGTCVNVGCIPKKLMHTASLYGESIHEAKGYGWEYNNSNNAFHINHSWEKLRENVQDYIKGLNFQYRVSLREKKVVYLNKLGSFLGPHELECIDGKGNKEVITSARFVIAVGGRPSPLDCPGYEYAITSDDLFSLEYSPKKTCVIGAGYVALECAGFLQGLNHGKVTVLIRSIPLRGFDRDVVESVINDMKVKGIQFIIGVTPLSIIKTPEGRYLVNYSNGDSDVFDTVLAAVGRYADTQGLQLQNIVDGVTVKEGIRLNPNNGKIICTHEQTSIPHVYAIGDVVDNVPELTPSAILAGKFLARRLYAGGIEIMDYDKVPTTVFTPLELGTVGLTEEEALSKYGEGNIDSYVSAFTPLEWAMDNLLDGNEESDEDPNDMNHDKNTCYIKVVVDVSRDQYNPPILGIHIASPHAGEIIQGLAIAFRKGLNYQDLIQSVGIHPTIAEEFTLLSVTKSSGEAIEKTDC